MQQTTSVKNLILCNVFQVTVPWEIWLSIKSCWFTHSMQSVLDTDENNQFFPSWVSAGNLLRENVLFFIIILFYIWKTVYKVEGFSLLQKSQDYRVRVTAVALIWIFPPRGSHPESTTWLPELDIIYNVWFLKLIFLESLGVLSLPACILKLWIYNKIKGYQMNHKQWDKFCVRVKLESS